jgi:type VI secretion system secreted protein Hcp
MGYAFYVTIKGKKQGAFKGESPQEATKDKIKGLGFAYELKSPRDAASGHASGKRQHSPIRIVKEWGAATPQIFQALVTNEVLSEVTMEFRKTDSDGQESVYYRIKLKDASVAGIRQFTSDNGIDGASSSKHAGSGNSQELEEISFTFRTIEVENIAAKTMGQDDWSTAS